MNCYGSVAIDRVSLSGERAAGRFGDGRTEQLAVDGEGPAHGLGFD